MRRPGLSLLAPVVVAAALLAACGDDDSTSSGGAPPSTAAATTAGAATTTGGDSSGGYGAPSGGATTSAAGAAAGTGTVALADLGGKKVLVNSEGFAVYLFTKDTGTTSTCTGGCAQAWPAVVAEGTPTAGEGVDADDLGTTKRDDGTMQVTFYGHPLYTFASDTAAGQTNGQGSGGVWFLVDAEGQAVK
jgi:predicted lipoprotein with Yx(FWY)xxD motif